MAVAKRAYPRAAGAGHTGLLREISRTSTFRSARDLALQLGLPEPNSKTKGRNRIHRAAALLFVLAFALPESVGQQECEPAGRRRNKGNGARRPLGHLIHWFVPPLLQQRAPKAWAHSRRSLQSRAASNRERRVLPAAVGPNRSWACKPARVTSTIHRLRGHQPEYDTRGFEPTRIAPPELESGALDHSVKVS